MTHVDVRGRTGVAPVLEVRGLRKVYGGTAALAGVDLSVRPGEIHALLGENGAGKSTLVKILAAVEHEDGGEIVIDAEVLPGRRTPRAMADRGVVFIHQDLGLVGGMTVAENVAQYAGYAVGRTGINWDATRARARDALSRLGVDINPDALVAELSIAEQATVAIARALALDARVVVLDEPTASLAAEEARRLFEILESLSGTGLSCIVVTHRIEEVLTHCDRVTVLRNGSLVATESVGDLTRERLVELIVGDTPHLPERREARGPASARLTVKELKGPGYGPVSFEVGEGEVVAVTGFADAGHLRLLNGLFGSHRVDEGEVWLDGRQYRPSSPAHALSRRVHQVPSDRIAEGLAPDLSARENMFLNPRGNRSWRPLNKRAETERARDWMTAFDVRPGNCEAPLSVFSGGNAQKVLIARNLADRPDLLLLCEPTAGVDVGARAIIYSKLRESCSRGLSILMASSDFQEVADIADRAIVMSRGSICTMLEADQVSVAAITGASYGN